MRKRTTARGPLTALCARDGRPRSAAFGALVGVGVLLILLSWIEAAGELRYEDQLTALNVGIVGEALVLAGCALYLVLYRRSVRARVHQVRADDEVLG